MKLTRAGVSADKNAFVAAGYALPTFHYETVKKIHRNAPYGFILEQETFFGLFRQTSYKIF